MLESKEIYVMGDNKYNQIGLGRGTRNVDKPTYLMKKENIKEVICGFYFTFVLLENGETFNFGFNKYGNLSNGSFDLETKFRVHHLKQFSSVQSVHLGGDHSIVLLSNFIYFFF